jgi:nitroreductase
MRMMKNFLQLVKERYSCRNYQERSVEQEKIDYIMECVRLAPSAVNRQPWRFRLITAKEDRQKLCKCYRREWLASAPAYIIASVLHDEEWTRFDGKPHDHGPALSGRMAYHEGHALL